MKINLSVKSVRRVATEAATGKKHPDTCVLDVIESEHAGFFGKARQNLATGLEATSRAIAPK